MKEKDNLILCGFKSCGKSYFGDLLAKNLECNFIDVDLEIEKSYQSLFREVLDRREIFKKLGREKFRDLEKNVVELLSDVNNSVISLGGGTLLDIQSRQILKKLGILVYLDLDKKILKERMLNKEIPPFLDVTDLENSFEKMYEERKSIYETFTDYKIQIDNLSDHTVIEKMKSLKLRESLLEKKPSS